MMWYNVIQYDAIWNDTIWCDVIKYKNYGFLVPYFDQQLKDLQC